MASLPVDRGWAWSCAFGVFVMNTLVYGGYRSSGILLVEFIETFNARSGLAAWAAGLVMICNTITPPLTGALSVRYGSRPLVMLGGVLVSLGYVVTSFSSSIYQVIFIYGIFTGIGYGCSYTPGLSILGHYFSRRFAMANGFVSAGVCLGQLLLPLLIRHLIDTYAFRGAMLICGALVLHISVGGALLRPPEFYKRRAKTPSSDAKVTEAMLAETNHFEDQREDFENKIASAEERSEHENGDLKMKTHVRSSDQTSAEERIANAKVDMERNTDTHSSDNNGSYSNQVNNYKNYSDSTKTVSHQNKTAISFDEIWTQRKEPAKSDAINKRKSRSSFFAAFNLSVFRICRFQIFIMALITGNIGCMNMVVIIPLQLKDIGISKTDAAAMLSLYAACELVSRLGCGILADNQHVRKCMKPHHFMVASYFGASFINFLFPLFTGRIALFASCGLLGVSMGGYYSIFTVVLKEFVGVKNYANALGFTLFFFGIGNTLGPPVMGWLRDLTGSYRSSFILAGACTACAAGVLLLEPLAARCDRKVNRSLSTTRSVN